jgi:O-antigen/teichoic acid export membrane protein
MLRPALLILSGNAAASGFLFVRNLAVAALVPVADYGIAATFALAMAAVEMASSFGLQQQIVQARDGDDPRLQDALTGFQLLRGVLSAIALFALAGPLAMFLGIPEVTWAYRVLALVPLLNALQHFDIHRLNRNARFGPLIAVNAVPAMLSLAVVWPLAIWVGDWRVMLGAILFQAATGAILSHLVAERPWRAAVDRVFWSRTLRFGWPILLNAVILFLVFQADKLAVGRILGMTSLGVFAMAVTLTLTPSLVAAKTIQTALLPRLSGMVDTSGFAGLAGVALTASMVAGLALACAGILLGWTIAPWITATGYAALPQLIGPLAVMQGIRIAKSGSTVVALSVGLTGNAALSNLPRIAALVAGVAALYQGYGLPALIWLGVAGETAGFVLSTALVTYRTGLRWSADQIALGAFGIVSAAAALVMPFLLLAALAALVPLLFELRSARQTT